MKCKEQFSLANDCTEIEYWRQLKNISMRTPTLVTKSYSIRGKRINIPLSRINLASTRPLVKNVSIKQIAKVIAMSNKGE